MSQRFLKLIAFFDVLFYYKKFLCMKSISYFTSFQDCVTKRNIVTYFVKYSVSDYLNLEHSS